MQNLDHKDVLIRTLKTAVATFLGVYVSALTNLFSLLQAWNIDSLEKALVALIPAAASAAVTAIWNYILQIRNAKKPNLVA